jgi:PTH1 family peptidyl-tRNA hydrolase
MLLWFTTMRICRWAVCGLSLPVPAQKGMASIIKALKTDEISRLRIGIGKPDVRIDLAEYVLEPFTRYEQEIMDDTVESASCAVSDWIKFGGEYVMKNYNNRRSKE